jgi:hypothetical protein
VYRTAKQGERFPITPFDPVGAWYCVYDPQTLVEYWIHGNARRQNGNCQNKAICNSKQNKQGREVRKAEINIEIFYPAVESYYLQLMLSGSTEKKPSLPKLSVNEEKT